ncbi:FAD-dependent oxidoreductase [Herbiconiux sp.]|uniref:NAD(P)/FAD-dependent oxidoreductase n=1 Tax=Herbiconiux sp. TaxID=1871186 RepID=UPI0025C63E8C|nr:FAD-dependent oxidoreductase [Herbiconiux sp.]
MTSSPAAPTSAPHSANGAGVLVVGAGIAGLACARALRDAGVPVRVVDRGRRPGGRMAGRTLHGRTVDLGASYFTVPDGSAFGEVVARWEGKGLAHPWSDTFTVLDAHGTGGGSPLESSRTTTGPMRYAAVGGLRSLLVDLAEELGADEERRVDVQLEQAVTSVHHDGTVDGSDDGVRYDTVVLAMPEPQAARLLAPGSVVAAALDTNAWEPTIAVALGFAERTWPADLHGAFVEASVVVSFLADDGDRRGDGAPVLVAHTTAGFAREHLEHPDGAVEAVVAEVSALLGLGESARPVWNHAHRWTYARTTASHPEPFALHERIGVCGDAWGDRSSVPTAWASGDALGRAIAARR